VESVSQPPKSERTSKVIDPQKTFWGDGYRAGKEAEQERIVTLLQEEHGSHPVGWNYTEWLIALIKGAKDD
jgi:hypothetical protein